MKVYKKEKLHIKLSYKEAWIIRQEFGELKGIRNNMKIVELMERFDMAGV
ncbi:MAG TPA: hypothetical protein VFD03_05885 [Clostridia bacterium]|nr:hypothetical protein [Clostridia bacterium]